MNKIGFSLSDVTKKYALPIIILVLCVIFTLMNDIFFTSGNLLNIVRQSSIMIIFTVGMTFVMVGGMIDISITGVACVTSMLAAILIEKGVHLPIAIISAMGLGLAFGLLNGILVTKFGLNTMIATLATNNIAGGATLLISGGTAVYALPNEFVFLGRGYIGVIPIQVVIMASLVILGTVVLSKTVFGRRVYAIGGNPQVAKLSGIHVDAYKISYYVICSLCAVLAGLIMTARNATAQPTPSSTTLMDVIAAVVIGGTSMSGGKGGIIGSVLGALLLTIIANGLTINDVSAYWQTVISAGILLITIIMYRKD